MKYNPQKHNRRSIRLQAYDYSKPGAYFVTICTRNRKCVFGEIHNGEMNLSNTGKIAQGIIKKISVYFPNIKLDEYVIMPNHIHRLIIQQYFSKISPKPGTLSVIIRTYKTIVTKSCRKIGMLDFKWQRNYHEHIVRNKNELNRIRNYIINNPSNWKSDSEHQ